MGIVEVRIISFKATMRVVNAVTGVLAAFLSRKESHAQISNAEWHAGIPLTTWSAKTVPSVCALDVFHFKVRFPISQPTNIYEHHDHFKWQLILQRENKLQAGTIVASGQLRVTQLSTDDRELEEDDKNSEEPDEDGLKCEFDSDFCIPKLVGIRLPNIDTGIPEKTSLLQNHTIVLNFEQPTNRPDAKSKVDIDRFVTFTEYIGDELNGMWSDDGRVVVIRITRINAKKVKPVGELMQGLLRTNIIVAGKKAGRVENKTFTYEGFQSLRIERYGIYTICILARNEVVLRSPMVTVVPCDASYVVLDSTRPAQRTEDIDGKAMSDTSPSFAIDGMLTHGGGEGFVLPHALIQMETPGSWSLSFWVFLIENCTGDFRSLFFHGDGENQQRTPSAWWKPNERRLVLRVSTTTSADVGIDSASELPLYEWVHMGFTFVNCSHSNTHEKCSLKESSQSWNYSYSLYIDGMLDTQMHIHESVAPNTGPLYIGKGPGTDGMRGFTSSIKVFPAPISPDKHRRLYLSERHLHEKYTNCVQDSSFEDEISEPTVQITYLTQCFHYLSKFDRYAVNGNVGLDNSFPVADTALEELTTALELCDSVAWDLLVEAADNGNPNACRDVGHAYLYGSTETLHHCFASIPVKQNLTASRQFLSKAFRDGVYSAGKPLALSLALERETGTLDGGKLDLLTTGLIHFAAANGEKDAFAMLGHRYCDLDTELATYYYYHAAVEAARNYHQHGKQPLHEMTRLYDSFKRDVTVGERGDDDEHIQFQKLRADNGDVEAMAAMGDIYYWGAHGISRDHEEAFKYYYQAAEAGDVKSQTAIAGMLLKGEGVAQDNVTAIKWYEEASKENHTRALNGLGFIHFYGSGGVAENKALALEYFERAAANELDGDSIFNAGYCHAMGHGTSVNISRAMEYYDVAAKKFGHFDAIFEMGKMYFEGLTPITRNCTKALQYLKAASDGGQWGNVVRKGFNLYINGEFERAVVSYYEAHELGYSVAISNLAFLFDQHLLQQGSEASERRALKYLLLTYKANGDKEVLVRIGDYHYYGLAGLSRDPEIALRWYSRASAAGVAVGAFNVGQMYELGDGVKTHLNRAHRYYIRALELAAEQSETRLATRIALARLTIRNWLRNTYLEKILGLKSALHSSQKSNMSATDSTKPCGVSISPFDGEACVLIFTVTTLCIAIGVWYLKK